MWVVINNSQTNSWGDINSSQQKVYTNSGSWIADTSFAESTFCDDVASSFVGAWQNIDNNQVNTWSVINTSN